MAINRASEAMTIFAVMHGRFISINSHGSFMGWILGVPFPNQFGSMWVNFQLTVIWDVFAISTYFSVSMVVLVDWIIPDFAMIRDRVNNPFQKKIMEY